LQVLKSSSMLFTCESVPNSYVRFDWSIRPIRSQVRRLHVLRLKKKVKFIRGNICLPFANTCVHSLVCGGVRAAPLCSCLCCPIDYDKRNRNIKNIFIMLQRGTNIMSNQVKISIQNYFEKSVVWKFDILDSSLVVFKSTREKN
jgi:hypothetical protein